MKCPYCKANALPVATVYAQPDPHVTYKCGAWKRCGKYFRRSLRR